MNTHRCLRLALRITCLVVLLITLFCTPALCQDQKPQLVVQVGHASGVLTVAISPDGKTIASNDKNTIKLWDMATGSLLRTFTGDIGYVLSVCFSPDSKTIATGSMAGTSGEGIRLWDTATGKLQRTLIGGGHTLSGLASVGDSSCVAFSPDSKLLAAVGGDTKTVNIWDLVTGKLEHTLVGHTGNICCVRFSPDGKTIASSSSDETVKLWESATGKVQRTLTGGEIPSLTFGDDPSLAFSPDGRTLAIGGSNGAVALWDDLTGTLLRSIKLPGDTNTSDYLSIAFSPDSKTLATGSYNDGKTFMLWDVAAGQLLRTFTGHAQFVTSVAFSSDGKTIISGSLDHTVKLWDAVSGKLRQTLTGTTVWVSSVAISPDGRTLASGSSRETIHLSDLVDPAFGSRFGYVTDATFIASGHAIELWDLSSGHPLHNLVAGTHYVTSMCFSPDGQILVSGNLDGTIQFWNTATGTLVRTLTGHSEKVNFVAFSPDGKTLISNDGTIRLWEVANGNLVCTLNIDNSLSSSVDSQFLACTSPDSKTIISRDVTGAIDITRISGRNLCVLYVFDQDGWAVLAPDGRFDGNDIGLQNLHYVVGLEPIDLAQLKNRYYEPGLLAKLMGYNKSPLRNVTSFDHVNLYPSIQTLPSVPANGKLALQLTNQGGGIGRVQVFVNGKELSADARGPNPDPQAKSAAVTVDVSHAPGLVPGQPNTVKVVTWNQEGYLSSRGVECVYIPPGQDQTRPPELWAIVGGISDYAAPSLHLTYPAKDAADFAHALTLAAGNLFGVDKVHLTLLDSDHDIGVVAPTKANLQRAFADARQAKPGDIFVVYLAGHGVALPGSGTNDQNDLYCYLTADATTGDPAALSHDGTLRQATTVSSEELTDWVKQVPARKQVMVLDTCAAGAAAALLTAKRDVPSDQIRAIERLKDRTGFYVLMGCAADAASYETSRYRQGLLTYSLLKGMKGASLRDGQYVDVGSLFNYAVDEVPQLAQNIGGVQRPFVAAPSAGSFDMGELSAADRQAIPLAIPRPMVLRPELVPLADDLNLEALLVARLREENAADTRSGAAGPGLAFVDATDFPGALQVRGAYTTDGAQVSVTLKLRRDGMDLKTLHLTGTRGDLPVLVGKLSTAITGATETP